MTRREWLCFGAATMLPQDQPGGFQTEEHRRRIDLEMLVRLLDVRRIFVERLNGGETAQQIRDMIIASLQATRLFLLTENPDRADAILKGSAEDLVFTDTFQSSDGISARASAGVGSSSSRTSSGRLSGSVGLGDHDSVRRSERRHEAVAAVRLVAKDGDVLWSTTQESLGGKFRGASADVADKITRQLVADYQRARGARSPAP